MKKIILPLLLSMFFHCAFAQEDEGVEIGGTAPKKPKFKQLQTGRMAAEAELGSVQGNVNGVKLNIDNRLLGRVSGLNIAANDTTKKGIRIRLRCSGMSIHNRSPLVVLDGRIVQPDSLNTISPNDIASIDILKAEKAVELYGRSGEFGALLIKTKQHVFERALLGQFSCFTIQDSMPGKVTFPLQPKPFVFNEERLIVVDGVPVTGKRKDIPGLDKIESINILKADSIFAHSNIVRCGPVRDVVLITTKPGQVRTLLTDRLSGQPVPNASVRFVFKQKNKPGKMIIADSAGYFSVEDKLLNRLSMIYISSVGYQEKALSPGDMAREIQLEPKFNALQPVVVSGYTIICRRSTDCILSTFISCPATRVNNELIQPAILPVLPDVSIYPNPVHRGKILQVRFTAMLGDDRLKLALLSVSGQPVYQASHIANKGSNQVPIQLPSQIAAGVYMLVVKNEQGRLVFKQQVIVGR